jgi:hypothetical protein
VPVGKTGSLQLLVAFVNVGAAMAGAGATKMIMEPHDKRRGPIIHLVRELMCIGFPPLWSTVCRFDLVKQYNQCQDRVLSTFLTQSAFSKPGGPPPRSSTYQFYSRCSV